MLSYTIICCRADMCARVYVNRWVHRTFLCGVEFPNPSCVFEGEDAVLEKNNVTCYTDLAVGARIRLTMANCTVIRLNFTALAASMASVLNVSACAVQLDLVSSDVVPPQRRLLQVAPGNFTLLMTVFLGDEQQGNDLVARLGTSVEQAILLSSLDLNIGDVVNIDITAALIQLRTVTSDPHFVTPQGHKFDFNGVAGQTYCIVTDKQLHVNARFVGAAETSRSVKVADRRPNDQFAGQTDDLLFDGKAHGQTDDLPMDGKTHGRIDDRTWMDQVSILHGGDRVLVEATSPTGASYSASFGAVQLNGP
eukprot:jgi/Mesvir1/17711/Mv03110-RA.1